jgi:hypothetical protein
MTASSRDRYVERVVEEGCAIALPELRAASLPDAVYHVRDRCGLGVVAIPETALVEHQLDALARFRFAQFMAAGYVDQDVAFRDRLDQCPHPTYTSPDTVHFVVFAAATGELLASMCMVGPPPAAADVRVATRDRPLLPVEEQFGWGPFSRLERVPDTPLARIRDYGRLVKNLRHPGGGPRAVVELILAPLRLGIGAWATAFDVVVGSLEPSRVQRNLEFFHIPLVALRSGLPCMAPDDPLRPALPVCLRGLGPRRHRLTPRCDRGGARAARLAGARRVPRVEAGPLGGAELAAACGRAPRPHRHAAPAAVAVEPRAPARA